MEETIFFKMKAKPGMTAMAVNAPSEYPKWKELSWQEDKSDFLHLFVASQKDFETLFSKIVPLYQDLFWISYPKATNKQSYDINRDTLWDLLIPAGFHPVSQVALDDHWSAVRIKPNEPGKLYERPNTKRS